MRCRHRGGVLRAQVVSECGRTAVCGAKRLVCVAPLRDAVPCSPGLATVLLYAWLSLPLLDSKLRAPYATGPLPERPIVSPRPTVADAADALSIASVTELAVGAQHTCALHADGRVSCWGSNRYSQLGITRLGPDVRATPVAVPGLRDAVQISASEAGTVRCAAPVS